MRWSPLMKGQTTPRGTSAALSTTDLWTGPMGPRRQQDPHMKRNSGWISRLDELHRSGPRAVSADRPAVRATAPS